MSEQLSRSVNEEANAALRERLEGSGFPFDQSYGGSLPGVEPGWREDGFVVFGMTRQQALEWGRSLQQRSLVWAKEDEIGLLFCSDGRFVACGVRGSADDG